METSGLTHGRRRVIATRPANLRLRIADPKQFVNPKTPSCLSFYRNDGFHRVLKKFKGKTVSLSPGCRRHHRLFADDERGIADNT